MLGSWPLEPLDEAGLATYRARIESVAQGIDLPLEALDSLLDGLGRILGANRAHDQRDRGDGPRHWFAEPAAGPRAAWRS